MTWFRVSMCIENDLILEWGSANDLISVLGSNVTCSLCGGSKLTWVFRVWGPKLTFVCAEVKIDLVFVCGPKITCFKCGDRLSWFLCGWSKLNWYCMRAINHLVVV